MTSQGNSSIRTIDLAVVALGAAQHTTEMANVLR